MGRTAYSGKEEGMTTTPGTYTITKTDSEWRERLDADQYAVLRKAATERPWSGALLDESREGVYTCAACDAELFRSGTKFDAGCGWPSFYESIDPNAVELVTDRSLGTVRTEVRCAACGSHLGHVFDDAPQTPTGERFCMNSLSLSFTEDEK
jgi:peptide-methionine (R)-S-oxide reductase